MGIKGGCNNPKCGTSTGVHEGLTFGWGKLDNYGYWEHPCPICARAWENSNPASGPCWPFSEEKVVEPKKTRILDDSHDYTLAPDCTGIWLTVKQMSVHVFMTDEGVVADIYALGHEMDDALASTYVFDSEAEDATEEAEASSKAKATAENPIVQNPVVPRTDEEALHRAELLGLKQYNVTIRATVTKTYRVDAENEDQATEEAHGIFSVMNDETPEDYEEETLHVEEFKPE